MVLRFPNYRGGPLQRGRLSVSLSPHKLAVIVTVTSELIKTTSLDVLGLITDAIGTDTLDAIDANLLSAQEAVPGIRPPGILHGADSTASVDIDTDTQWLFDTLVEGAGSSLRNPVIIMNPINHLALKMTFDGFGNPKYPSARDEDNPRMFNMDIITSTNVPDDVVIACAPHDIAFLQAEEFPEYTTGPHATLVMADDDPESEPNMTEEDAVSVEGSIKISGAADQDTPAVVASVFQQGKIALRMVHQLTWGQLRSGSVCHLTGVNW